MALTEKALQPLPLGQVRPASWLFHQLRRQADGLTGHLDEFWPDVARSRWIGGDVEGWERGPYWLDGMVPLAYLLDDARLIAKVRHWVEQILAHQDNEGWLGPVLDAQFSYPYDPWPRFVVLKSLTQYHGATGDERILHATERFFHKLDASLDARPLRSWARFRWADLVVSVHWLYERTHHAWLLELAEKVERQGFDWRAHFERFPYREKCRREECDLTSHGVNNAMAIKAPGAWYQQTGDSAYRDAALRIIDELDRYHGQATGMFSCDEHLAGRMPSQGVELCSVVEYMYSLETLLAVFGMPALADRLESLAYNALPATISPDMWAHQYDGQVNQVVCRVSEDRVYTSNGPASNIYGLEPNYGCCTANMHQGWPKLAAHLWMRSSDGGLAAVVYAPCTVNAEVNGAPIQIEVRTDYPFDGEVRITVHTESPVRFPLHLRVPGWAAWAELIVDDEDPAAVEAGSFHRIERVWQGNTPVFLRLPMRFRVERRYKDAISIYRGPLLFSLRIGEDWRLIAGEPPHGDWEIYPTTPWNYALDIDPAEPDSSLRLQTSPAGDHPFSPEGAPVSAAVTGRRLPEWTLEHNAAAPAPPSPVHSSEPPEELTLVPFGCTNLRVAEFPLLDKSYYTDTASPPRRVSI